MQSAVKMKLNKENKKKRSINQIYLNQTTKSRRKNLI